MFSKANYKQLIKNGEFRKRHLWIQKCMKILRNVNLFRKKHQKNLLVAFFTVLSFLAIYYTFYWDEYRMGIEIIDRADDFEKMKKNGQITWTLANMAYYPKLNESPLNLTLFTWANKEDNEATFPGYWILRRKTDNEATITIENLHPVHIIFGLKLAVYGRAKITVKYTYPDWTHEPPHTSTVTYHYNNDVEKLRFCSKIFFDDIEENKKLIPYHIDIKLEVESDSGPWTNSNQHKFIIIDKMFLTIGNNGASENFIHTVIPKEWCGVMTGRS